MNEKLSSADMSVAVQYIDGSLSDDERLRFELRLAAEPELAAAVEALLSTDEMLRSLTAREEERLRTVRRLRPWVWAASLAAAALALFALALGLMRSQRTERSFTVALAPSWESMEEFSAQSAQLRGLRPPGFDTLRGEPEEANVGAQDFADKARAVEAELASSRSGAPLEAEFFVVPFATSEPRSLVVLALPANGVMQRLVPDTTDSRPIAEQARFGPGEHVLPSRRIELVEVPGEPALVRYHRGFVVPLGARELCVLVAAREAPLDAQTLASIDAALAESRSSALDHDERRIRARLQELGFTFRELTVREPAQ